MYQQTHPLVGRREKHCSLFAVLVLRFSVPINWRHKIIHSVSLWMQSKQWKLILRQAKKRFLGDYSQLTGWFVDNKHYNTSYRMVSMVMAHCTTFCHIETSRIKSWSYTVRVRSCHSTTHCLGFRRCRANPKNGWRARVCRLTSLRRLSYSQQQCLSVIEPSLQWSRKKLPNPYSPASLPWANWLIARFRGWSGYSSHTPAGMPTLVHGLWQFESIFLGWKLAQNQLVCTR